MVLTLIVLIGFVYFLQQEDIRSYIDNSLKTGVHLSVFRKDRVGGDSHGVNFWYGAKKKDLKDSFVCIYLILPVCFLCKV